jgi:hypothetical protein
VWQWVGLRWAMSSATITVAFAIGVLLLLRSDR